MDKFGPHFMDFSVKGTSMQSRTKSVVLPILLLAILLGGTALYGALQPSTEAYAGASVVGEADGATSRMLVTSNGSDRVRRIVYFKLESHDTGGVNTPVASGSVCDMAGVYHSAEVKLSGTLTGSAPTLAIKWQNSKDGGTTWADVGTWTQINATVTPATQSNTVTDHGENTIVLANTPVTTPATMYGDCWRVTYTMGAGGAGVFSVTGLEK